VVGCNEPRASPGHHTRIEVPKLELPQLALPCRVLERVVFPVIAAGLIVLLAFAVGFAVLALLVIDVFEPLVAKAEAKAKAAEGAQP
jgi:hypothetical protein